MVALAHHTTIGDGTPLVFLGSLGSDRSMWEPQVTALGAGHRVIAVDLRGHGESATPPGPYTVADLGGDVVELIDSLGIPDVHLVGLSLGGAVAQWIAGNRPDRVRTLSLLCTAAKFGEPSGWLDRADFVRANGTAALADAVVARWFTPEFATAQTDLVARSRAMIAATEDEGYANCCAALAGWDNRADLASITAPTLVIAGEQDPATTPADLRIIADGVANSTFHVLDPGAHLVNLEQSEHVSALIAKHIEVAR